MFEQRNSFDEVRTNLHQDFIAWGTGRVEENAEKLFDLGRSRRDRIVRAGLPGENAQKFDAMACGDRVPQWADFKYFPELLGVGLGLCMALRSILLLGLNLFAKSPHIIKGSAFGFVQGTALAQAHLVVGVHPKPLLSGYVIGWIAGAVRESRRDDGPNL